MLKEQLSEIIEIIYQKTKHRKYSLHHAYTDDGFKLKITFQNKTRVILFKLGNEKLTGKKFLINSLENGIGSQTRYFLDSPVKSAKKIVMALRSIYEKMKEYIIQDMTQKKEKEAIENGIKEDFGDVEIIDDFYGYKFYYNDTIIKTFNPGYYLIDSLQYPVNAKKVKAIIDILKGN